jgi:hypothetical protein
MFCRKVVVALGLLAALSSFTFAVSFTEDFSANPFAVWSFGFGGADPSTNRFVWNSSAPAAYAGDAVGALAVHLDSSLPTVRLQRPLGVTLTDTNDFTLIARFSFTITAAPTNQSIQMAFGLINSSLTGGNRTGTDGVYIDDDVFDTVEFNYFPQTSTYSSTPTGPTLTPAVFGAHAPGNDAFGNFAAFFFTEADLHDNTTGIKELPQSVTLQATLAYNGTTKTTALTMYQVKPDGALTYLNTELPAMNLALPPFLSTYDTNFPFVVDAVAIMAYQDGFTTTNNPSLIADLTFQRISFYSSPPPPPNFVSVKITATDVMLCFPTLTDFVYDVQSRTDLATGSWSATASNIAGTGGVVTNIDFGAAAALANYYRVVVISP